MLIIVLNWLAQDLRRGTWLRLRDELLIVVPDHDSSWWQFEVAVAVTVTIIITVKAFFLVIRMIEFGDIMGLRGKFGLNSKVNRGRGVL